MNDNSILRKIVGYILTDVKFNPDSTIKSLVDEYFSNHEAVNLLDLLISVESVTFSRAKEAEKDNRDANKHIEACCKKLSSLLDEENGEFYQVAIYHHVFNDMLKCFMATLNSIMDDEKAGDKLRLALFHLIKDNKLEAKNA